MPKPLSATRVMKVAPIQKAQDRLVFPATQQAERSALSPRAPLAGTAADLSREKNLLLSGYSLISSLSNRSFSLSGRLKGFSRELADLLGEARVTVNIKNGVMIEETSSSRAFDAGRIAEKISLNITVGNELFGVLEVESSRLLTEGEKAFLQKIPEQIGNSVHTTEEFDRLRQMAFTDELTGLANRRAFTQEALKHLEHAKQTKEPLCLLLLDLNKLKAINDVHGHDAGNAALKHVAESLRHLPEGSFSARCGNGSDEFFVLLNGDCIEACMLAKQIHSFLAEHKLPFGAVSVAIGIAQFNNREDLGSLMKRADDHMYAMKKKANG